MGTRRTLRCPNCGYKDMISAGPDGGFSSSTDTFVCKTCNTLHDLYLDRSKSKTEEHPKILDWQTCPCGNPEFELWDHRKKSCPKCGTSPMVVDLGGSVMHWD